MNKTTVEKIASQALNEIQFARTFRQGKVKNWQTNEQMYYGRYKKAIDSRASVQLGRMQEFVHTLLSKIDNPLSFKFTKRKNAQLKRVDRLNALRQIDQDQDNWNIKDLVGKKQAIIYGRAIYSYYADSIDGYYKTHLEPIDVYDFLIDPSCGGIDVEEARYLGHRTVVLDKKMLKDGAAKGIYIKSTVKELLDGGGNADDATQERTNKQPRTYDQNTNLIQKERHDTSKFKFWRWFTTYQEDGERYYLLMDNAGNCIRCELLSDLFSPVLDDNKAMWPIWTWAAFPDLTEFWTPSYCDYARDILMAQDVTINQMLDNAEAINKPQKVVNVSAIEDMASLKYRRDGIIKVKGDIDINKAYQTVITPSIDTPIKVFNILETIQEKASGVTDGAKGVSDTSGKVGIYEGNQEAAADRFGLLNKSYAFGYKRFAKLYEVGVRDNLIKKVAVEIMGPDGIEIEKIKRTDIFKKDDDFGVMVEASNAEILASNQDKIAKINFLNAEAENPAINQKKSFEIRASVAGFTEDEIDELLDVTVYGNSELMSEADEDLEDLLEGEEVRPNQAANNAYMQRMVNYLRDHQKDMSAVQFKVIEDYINSLEPIIMRNEARNMQLEVTNQLNAKSAAGASGPVAGAPAAPNQPGTSDLAPPPTALSPNKAPAVAGALPPSSKTNPSF